MSAAAATTADDGEGEDSRLFLGVDVGTGSARVAVFTGRGARLATARRNIATWTNSGFPEGSFEQSSEDIWCAVCSAVKVIIITIDNATDLTFAN